MENINWLAMQGRRYRMRVISNGFLNCPIQLSVDNHTLLIIASDGGPVQPIEGIEIIVFHLLIISMLTVCLYIVDSVVIDAGERFDFVIKANQEISSYWMRLHGLMDCRPKEVFQAAIIRYNGAPETEPEEILTYDNTRRPGKVWNIFTL